MNKTQIALIAYSALLVIGGTVGFITAGSRASLIMSSSFALLTLLSLYVETNYPTVGYKMTYALLAILSAFFIYRSVHLGKFMPSGMLALITLAVIGFMYINNRNT